jgi:hypothetical protein
VYTLVGIVCGTIFFQEWKDMSVLALCMYAVGFLGMAVGIRVGISAKELAEGLEQMDEGDFDEDVSDGASGQHFHYQHLKQHFHYQHLKKPLTLFLEPAVQNIIVSFRNTHFCSSR